MKKRPPTNPRIARQGGPKATVSTRFAPTDMKTIREGAAAAGETPSDTISLGALARARANLMRAAASQSTDG